MPAQTTAANCNTFITNGIGTEELKRRMELWCGGVRSLLEPMTSGSSLTLRLGVISDTHGSLPVEVRYLLSNVDRILNSRIVSAALLSRVPVNRSQLVGIT